MIRRAMERCCGCGGIFPASDGPTHACMVSSAGCWAAYGEVLAREYADPAIFSASHRLTVDAYAVQHPGNPDDRRAVQSVWLHFAALDAIFGQGATPDAARELLREMAGRTFPALPAMPAMTLTVADVRADVGSHSASVETCARSAYEAWKPLLA
ncbi:DUF5946 family protein [Sphingomonas sp. MMS24-J45]|uniref:DUF5946 family protein n=1 Tax=Sphingomonas sp. MMS24-J45 TaxID=3238806 RepID=UPI00384B26DC